MLKLLKLLCLCIILFQPIANADTAPANISAQLRKTLKDTLPQLPIDQVNISPIGGIYEIISGRKVFYVDSTGRYAMLGNMVDLTIKQSLTEQKVKSLSVVDWNKIPTKIAIVKIIGKGQRKIAVFTDPDCPFCKRLDADILTKQKDLTIYYFLYPMAMHANSDNDAKRIICAENPDVTYIDWMVNDKTLPIQSQCKRLANLEQMKKVGSEIVGVEATPTIVLPNGQIVSGLIPADYLDKLITDTTPAPAAPANESGVKPANESQVKPAVVTSKAPSAPVPGNPAK
ncbi:MAG: thiol:disulfide interchange protein [Burkholderiales bacterium]|jgi:thiol:disulfide interchange protein DsbC|nr:thiol:disulfide interchange protein [Burkholderiales bacterium]